MYNTFGNIGQPTITGRVGPVDGIVAAVSEHIVAQNALAGGNKAVGVEIAPGLQVIIP